MDSLGGIAEVAELLGVSRQRVASLRSRPGFPAPLAELAAGPIFDLESVERWAKSARRAPGRPRAKSDRVLGERYALEPTPIGQGGFGMVYRATDRQAESSKNVVVAVKVLDGDAGVDPIDFARFRREQRILMKERHANVVPALDSGEEPDGTLWYVMPLARGSLADRIDDIVGDVAAAVAVVRQVAAGLAHLHEQDIIHRDVKPGNVLRLRRDAWAVSDLGLARRLGSHQTTTLTETGEGVGSWWYTAAEQWTDAKAVTKATDIFGLGRILHVLLTGEEGPVTDIDHQALRAVVRKATDGAPSRRYASIVAFVRALDDAASSPTGVWRTRDEELAESKQDLAERLRGPVADPTAVREVKQLIAASEDDEDLLEVLDETLPYLAGPALVDLWREDPDMLRDFLQRFAEHVRHRGFEFSYTDQIASFFRRCLTATDDDPDVLRASVYALMGVGARHNRWRVRDAVEAILQTARTAPQAMAVAEAIRDSDDYDVAWSVEELNLGTMHPIVAAAIEEATSRE